LELDQTKRWTVNKLMTHEFILEDNVLASNLQINLDKVDLIRTNAMNYNQDMLKKSRKSTKDLVDSSPDSIGQHSKSKKDNSPKYLNIKGQDQMFRTVRTSQQSKRKDHSQENDKTDFRSSMSKSNLRQTFYKEKQIDIRKTSKQNPNLNIDGGL